MRSTDVELQEFKLPETKYQSSSPRGEGVRRIMIPTQTENNILLQQDEHAHKITNLYSCCCFTKPTDRRLLTFLAQFGMSVLVIIFAIYKLSTENNCACDPINNSNVFYSSILMGTIGIWLPSPSINKHGVS